MKTLPIAPNSRIDLIDALRGSVLFGMGWRPSAE
jgi:uncharacterized membrane protein YeiB